VPDLIGIARDTNAIYRTDAMAILAKNQFQPDIVIPVLKDLVHDPNGEVQSSAISCLVKYRPKARTVFPDLVNRWQSETKLQYKSWMRKNLQILDPEAAEKNGIR